MLYALTAARIVSLCFSASLCENGMFKQYDITATMRQHVNSHGLSMPIMYALLARIQHLLQAQGGRAFGILYQNPKSERGSLREVYKLERNSVGRAAQALAILVYHTRL